MVFFQQIEVGPMQNFNYIIADESSHEALIVDPAFEEGRLLDILKKKKFRLVGVLLTHTHMDHIEALGRVLSKGGIPVYVHEAEKEEIKEIASDVRLVKDKDKIQIGEVTIIAHHTPGHTKGGITYEVDRKLLTGDALFVEGCGRTDLPGGNMATLKNSLRKIASFPDDYEIYPGHDYGSIKSSTVKHEKKNNPFLKF